MMSQPETTGIAVHLAHCNQGEWIGSCKYGEDLECPALGAKPAPHQDQTRQSPAIAAATIAHLSELKENWDSYGGQPIDRTALAVALLMTGSTPQVVPCPNGGVQLEWHEGGFDIELEINPGNASDRMFMEIDNA